MNSTLIIIEIILIILLVLLNAILSLAEIAIVSAIAISHHLSMRNQETTFNV